MAEYFIFLSTSIGLTLSLIGLCLWQDHRRLRRLSLLHTALCRQSDTPQNVNVKF
jgi:hypothetical protein